MRKALTVLLAALVLLSAGFAAASGVVNSQKENIIWEEETLYGNKSQVSGARVTTHNHSNSHLLWKTVGVLGAELQTDTKFTFSNEAIRFDHETTYEGIYLDATEDFLASLSFVDSNDRMPAYAVEKYADLIAYCKACFESVEIGVEKYFTLDLGEYMEYYSLGGSFDFPNCDWFSWDEFGNFYSRDMPESVIQSINEFFRIPILGDYIVEFSVNRYQAGNAMGTSFGGGIVQDAYRPNFDAVYVDDTCYLSFDAVADTGEIADTSLIPGGYGLYRLNTSRDEKGKLVLGDPVAEMVFPMDPAEEFNYLETSDDSRHIYLHTWQGTKLIRTILDIETMEPLQRIELLDTSDDFYCDMDQYDDFLVIRLLSINNQDPAANSITVFQEDEQGLYHHCFTVPMNTAELNVHEDLEIFNSITESMDFNGETLLVVQNEFESGRYAYSYGDNCNFYVLAYNADGLSYAGKYHVNLSKLQSGPDNENWLCKPFFDDPISICWN